MLSAARPLSGAHALASGIWLIVWVTLRWRQWIDIGDRKPYKAPVKIQVQPPDCLGSSIQQLGPEHEFKSCRHLCCAVGRIGSFQLTYQSAR